MKKKVPLIKPNTPSRFGLYFFITSIIDSINAIKRILKIKSVFDGRSYRIILSIL